MRKLFLAALFLVSIASAVHAAEMPRTDRQKAYLSEMHQTLSAQEVEPKILEIMDDHLLSMGKMYCVWKDEPKMFQSYDRLGLLDLKRQEEQLRGHPMEKALYKYYALIQLTHKQPAERHLCPGTIPYP
jgi:hypothetical protein